MCRKLICLASIVVMLGLSRTSVGADWDPDTDPNLVGHWKLDDGAGTVAVDSSTLGNDGTLVGDPQWTVGRMGGALDFDGSDHVDTGYTEDLTNWTIACWANSPAAPSGSSPSGPVHREQNYQFNWNHGDATFRGAAALNVGGTWYAASYMPLEADTWYHLAATYDGDVLTAYRNGVLITSNSAPSGAPSAETNSLKIARHAAAAQFYTGRVDEVRIYNRALTAEEIDVLVPPQLKAYKPSPPDGAKGVDTPLLQWTGGDTAILHLVYLGTDPDNLTFIGEQGWTVYWHAAGLTPGATYYWRVDEKETDGTIHEGDLWSFTAMPLIAWDPSPADGATDVPITAKLAWTAGKSDMAPLKHHVFFGTDQAEVADGTGDTDKGILDDPTYDPGPLKAETVYYFRVNEVETDGTEREGEVWSFETVVAGPGKILRQWWLGLGGTTLATLTSNANYPNNPDGWEFVDLFEGPVNWQDNYGSRLSGWLFPPGTGDYTFWIATDDPGQCWLSTDEDPANAVMICEVTGWVPSRDFDNTGGGIGGPEQRSAPISLEAGKRYWIEANMKEGGGGDNIAVAWQGPGIPVREVISAEYVGPTPYLPERAYAPSPGDGATGVPDSVVVSWQPGVKAVQHDVYFGTDAAAVAAADTTTPLIYRGRLSITSYIPTESPLEWGRTYYLRVDEVNNDATMSAGRVWSFTTADYILVDDFEDYNDYSPDRIFQTWIDGFGYTDPPPGKQGNGTGSTVGYLTAPFAEQTTVHGGGQSMPFGYDNTAFPFYSEAEREFPVAQNFTRRGVKSMSLWIYGDPCNVPATVYVGLQDSTGTRIDVPETDTTLVTTGRWREVNIELSKFAPVNLMSVKKIYLGVGNRLSPSVGGTGDMLVDDIRLYGPRCVASLLKPDADLSGNCVVDYLDVEMLSADWLLSDVTESVWDAPFTSADVGVPLAGSYSFDGTTYTVTGNGHDIWDEADNFHYAYHQISGDCQMTVRVKSMTQVHTWAKAGVMIRDTLDAGSPNAMVALTGGDGDGGTFQWRTDPDATCGSSRTLTGITPPACVRLVREGDTFTGYIFLDGRWQQEGVSTDVVMTDPVYIGLAVTSHTDGVLETATFDRECTFSMAEIHADGLIDFKDYAALADAWLDELLWPAGP
ncbi:MAG: hypothetical protein JSU70_17345 [Phycisphaerales bacterium]|nr:MAG: hypothetical protein JSU70_17345 [Phycisphaerales bacterium]